MGVDVGRQPLARLRRWQRVNSRPYTKDEVRVHRFLWDQLIADLTEAAETLNALEQELEVLRETAHAEHA
jgi:hypothetical protein